MKVIGASDEGRAIYNAASGQVIARVPDSDGHAVREAVVRGLEASSSWSAINAHERTDRLMRFADALETAAEELAYLDTDNTGNPIRTSRSGIATGIRALRYFAGLTSRLTGETIPMSSDHLHYTIAQPYGVVGVITPFNHPALYAIGRTAAALAAGNCVLLKPAHQSPMSAFRVAEIARESLPENVYQVVPGGPDTGSAIVRDPDVLRIAFTGSLRTALVMQAEAATAGFLKRFTFELGGKNPLIVLPDADPEAAASAAVTGMSLTRVLGQSCGSTSRLLVHEDLHRDLRDRIHDQMAALHFGPPRDEATALGTLISEEQRLRVESFVERGVSEGAQLLLGGRRPTSPPFDRGFYYPPTLFDAVEPGMTIAQEEIFGPVLSIISWSSLDEVVKIANGGRYGLTASIYTNDLRAAHRLARDVHAGYVWINEIEKRWVGVPFGGTRASGMGTEYGEEELRSFTVPKTVNVSLQ